MDCLFNNKIPDSTPTTQIYRPSSKTFITGIASSYAFYYDKMILGTLMKESQFNYLTNSINEELFSFWPCTLCIACGYLCSPCTLGLSFLCPYNCISSAKENLLIKIENFNRQHFHPRGLTLTYHQSCSTSWISLSIGNIQKNGGDNIKPGNLVSINQEKEFEFGSQTEIKLKSVDSQLKVELLK